MKKEILYLRKATIDDVHQFAAIKAEAYQDDRARSIPPKDNTPEWYDGEWYIGLGIINEKEAQRIIETYESFIILLKDKVIGGFWVHEEKENTLTLEDFCILPEYQGKGYGTRALYLLEQQFPRNNVWTLSTPFFCKRNRHLYEKVGYTQVGQCSNNTVILYEKCIN
ncbi:MAG: GNAT family N-acetyltransferase [Mobilitalea sp.]